MGHGVVRTEVGSRACDPAGGMIYVPPGERIRSS